METQNLLIAIIVPINRTVLNHILLQKTVITEKITDDKKKKFMNDITDIDSFQPDYYAGRKQT